jgi:hypothetical protein
MEYGVQRNLLIFVLLILLYFSIRVSNSISVESLTSNTLLATGGLLSGGLHAISGPDHFLALIPIIIGRSYCHGIKVGVTWSFGHALATSAMGLIAYILKDSIGINELLFSQFNFMNIAVGISLLAIGIVGLKEGNSMADERDNEIDELSNLETQIDTTTTTEQLNNISILKSTGSIDLACLLNGFVLGLSWDSLPSLTPVLAASSDITLLIFLLFYLIGTILAMSLIIALLSYFFILFEIYYEKMILIKLAYITSFISILIGIQYIIYNIINNIYTYDITQQINNNDDGTNVSYILITSEQTMYEFILISICNFICSLIISIFITYRFINHNIFLFNSNYGIFSKVYLCDVSNIYRRIVLFNYFSSTASKSGVHTV